MLSHGVDSDPLIRKSLALKHARLVAHLARDGYLDYAATCRPLFGGDDWYSWYHAQDTVSSIALCANPSRGG